jgi:hypothetical protein
LDFAPPRLKTEAIGSPTFRFPARPFLLDVPLHYDPQPEAFGQYIERIERKAPLALEEIAERPGVDSGFLADSVSGFLRPVQGGANLVTQSFRLSFRHECTLSGNCSPVN